MSESYDYEDGLIDIDPDWSFSELECAKEAVAERINLLEEAITSIAGQIIMHEGTAKANHTPVDAAWIARANTAAEYKKLALRRLRKSDCELDRMLLQAKREHDLANYERLFFQAARRVLPVDAFNAVRMEANRSFDPA